MIRTLLPLLCTWMDGWPALAQGWKARGARESVSLTHEIAFAVLGWPSVKLVLGLRHHAPEDPMVVCPPSLVHRQDVHKDPTCFWLAAPLGSPTAKSLG